MQAPLSVSEKGRLQIAEIFIRYGLEGFLLASKVLAKPQNTYGIWLLDLRKT